MHRTTFCSQQKGTDAEAALVDNPHYWAGIIDLTVFHRFDSCTTH